MGNDVVTQHYNNSRTGWNANETALTVANVRPHLRRLFTLPVDGQLYAQSLYVQGLAIPGKGTHNVVFVTSEGDSVYAFDADVAGAAIWHRTLVPAGESTVATADLAKCDNVGPKIGITSTPVIDRTTNLLYVVTKTKSSAGGVSSYHQRLHTLDLATGTDKPGSPVEIAASIAGSGDGHDNTGHIHFNPLWQLNRPGLLLTQGAVYLAFGAHCDFGPYHGWILKYDVATLQPLGVFNTTPDLDPNTQVFRGRGGGIWQGGIGLAASNNGHIYLLVGNGPFDANTGGRDYGNTVLRLNPDLTIADSFTPYNQDGLNQHDTDLGSGGAMLLPPQPGAHTSLLVACGKEGTIYLVDRLNMGKYNGPNGPDRVVQSLHKAVGGIWGGPAYYHGPTGPFVYYCGTGDHLKAFALNNDKLSPATQTARTFSHRNRKASRLPASILTCYPDGADLLACLRFRGGHHPCRLLQCRRGRHRNRLGHRA